MLVCDTETHITQTAVNMKRANAYNILEIEALLSCNELIPLELDDVSGEGPHGGVARPKHLIKHACPQRLHTNAGQDLRGGTRSALCDAQQLCMSVFDSYGQLVI